MPSRGQWRRSSAEVVAQAKSKGYRSDAHVKADSQCRKKNYDPKTRRDHEKAWKKFLIWLGQDVGSSEDEQANALSATPARDYRRSYPEIVKGTPAPPVEVIKDFVRFQVGSSTGSGLIDKAPEKRPTAASTCTFMEWIFAKFESITEEQIPCVDRQETYHWIRTELGLVEGLVSTQRKEKYLFGLDEFTDFSTCFWTTDNPISLHPRHRVQIPFLISLYTWTGQRIGAFLPTPAKPKHPGLLYEDVELVLERTDNKGWQVMYAINQRYIKNNKDPENLWYGASTAEHRKVIFDDTQYLISMALADKAIQGIETPEQLWNLSLREGEKYLTVPWKDEVKKLPILRQVERGTVTTKPYTEAAFSKAFKAFMQACGYFRLPSVHSIRRQAGKTIDKHHTEVERSQHLTQTDTRVFGQSYVGRHSSVCGKTCYTGEAVGPDHVKYFQTFQRYKEEGFPTELPAAMEAALYKQSGLESFKLKLNKSRKHSMHSQAESAAYSTSKSKLQAAQREKLKDYQEQWIHDRRKAKMSNPLQRDRGPTNKDLLSSLSRIYPQYGRLSKIMASHQEVGLEQRKLIVQDLYFLLVHDWTVVYYPNEGPSYPEKGLGGEVCPVESCGKPMQSYRKHNRASHIIACRRMEVAKSWNRIESDVEYCYFCFDWYPFEKWADHCDWHVRQVNSRRCGVVTHFDTVVRPAICPFCLGRGWWRTFRKGDKLRSHLEGHLNIQTWPSVCPHPLCDVNCDGETTFLHHLSDDHHQDTKTLIAQRANKKPSEKTFISYVGDSGQQRKNGYSGDRTGDIASESTESSHSTTSHDAGSLASPFACTMYVQDLSTADQALLFATPAQGLMDEAPAPFVAEASLYYADPHRSAQQTTPEHVDLSEWIHMESDDDSSSAPRKSFPSPSLRASDEEVPQLEYPTTKHKKRQGIRPSSYDRPAKRQKIKLNPPKRIPKITLRVGSRAV